MVSFFSNSDFTSRICCHFFRTTSFWERLLFHTFSELLLRHNSFFFRGSYFFRAVAFFSFFRTVTFSQELFFQKSFFFGVKLLQSRHFLKIGSSLRQLLFGTTFFFREELFRIKISKKELLFKAGTSAQYQLFRKS